MANRIRILRLILEVSETSAEYYQFSLPLRERHEITVCSYFKPTVCFPKSINLFQGDGTINGFLKALKSALHSEEYDVVHAHSPHVGFLYLVAGNSCNSTVYTIHNSYHNYKLRNRLLLIPIFPFFRRLIHCSMSSRESFPRFFKHLGGDRIRVIQNGVDLERVDYVTGKESYITNEEFKLVSVGQLIERKDPQIILRSLENLFLGDVKLVFVGEGYLAESLQRETYHVGLDKNVEFTGLVMRDAVYRYLANADLFISASYGEGLPIAVLEAMACRCPVLLSDIPPHREIASGVDFIPTVPPGDVDGFSREIQRFRAMDPIARREVGEKCRQLVEDRFSLKTMLDHYQDVYQELIRSRLPSYTAV